MDFGAWNCRGITALHFAGRNLILLTYAKLRNGRVDLISTRNLHKCFARQVRKPFSRIAVLERPLIVERYCCSQLHECDQQVDAVTKSTSYACRTRIRHQSAPFLLLEQFPEAGQPHCSTRSYLGSPGTGTCLFGSGLWHFGSSCCMHQW